MISTTVVGTAIKLEYQFVITVSTKELIDSIIDDRLCIGVVVIGEVTTEEDIVAALTF